MGKWFAVAIVALMACLYGEASDLAEDNAAQRQREEFDRQNAELFAIVNRPKKSKVMCAERGPVIATITSGVLFSEGLEYGTFSPRDRNRSKVM